MKSITPSEFYKDLDRLSRYLHNEHKKGKEVVTLGDMTFTGFAPDVFITVKRRSK